MTKYKEVRARADGITSQERLNEILEYHFLRSDREPLLVRKLRKQLDIEQIVFVLNVIFGTCNQCWDSDTGCYCCRDD